MYDNHLHRPAFAPTSYTSDCCCCSHGSDYADPLLAQKLSLVYVFGQGVSKQYHMWGVERFGGICCLALPCDFPLRVTVHGRACGPARHTRLACFQGGGGGLVFFAGELSAWISLNFPMEGRLSGVAGCVCGWAPFWGADLCSCWLLGAWGGPVLQGRGSACQASQYANDLFVLNNAWAVLSSRSRYYRLKTSCDSPIFILY